MEILNFTAVEILPSLLDKSKTQTIRPAWEIIKDKKMAVLNFEKKSRPLEWRIEKQPRFKVGDKVKLMWNQRSSFKWFCKEHGHPLKEAFTISGNLGISECGIKYSDLMMETMLIPPPDIFNKLLGTGIIIDIFKIRLANSRIYNFALIQSDGSVYAEWNLRYKDCSDVWEIVSSDGFKSAEDFLNYFDKMYNIAEGREFWVYRWRYLE